MDVKPVKLNAFSAMTFSLTLGVNPEFDSNVIDESDSQCEKHSGARILTLQGITIDESDLQCEKHSGPRILTLQGITID
jgi:hypothetical protein